MGKTYGKYNLKPWLASSPLNKRGNCSVYPASPCCCSSQHFFPCKQPSFLPPTPEIWIFLLVLCFGRREEHNELQLFNQAHRAPTPQTALNDKAHSIYTPPVQNQQSEMDTNGPWHQPGVFGPAVGCCKPEVLCILLSLHVKHLI